MSEPADVRRRAAGNGSGTAAAPVLVRPNADGNGRGRANAHTRLVERAVSADAELEAVVARLLALLGEDPDREGLHRTPARVGRALRYLTGGYGRTARDAIGDAVFEQEHDGLVLVRDIEFHSLCEHHLLPFHGRVHVAYVPNGRVVGLSKLARLVQVYARRLQVQERLTDQIAHGLYDALRPAGVAVAIEAKHMCMSMRGVEQPHAETVTRSYLGRFLEDEAARGEFLRLALRT